MTSSVTYQDNSNKSYEADSPLMNYDYELVTPFRATLSAALVLGKKALISADYEYLDYSLAKFRNGGDGENFVNQNKDIQDIYKPVSNFRLGGEYRLTDNFALRAGYEIYPSAFNENAFGSSQPNAGQSHNIISAGLGYSYGSFTFDAAYRLSTFTEYNTLYPSPQSSDYPAPEMAKMENKNGKVLFTLGFRF
jgi:long-subunit fatty acid transport protein